MPVGTADKVRDRNRAARSPARGASVEFDVVSNPEFLKEGAAIEDFMKPDRVVIGTDNPRTAELLRALYEPFTRNHDRLIVMDIRSAELTKYAANAMLATKISFMNELANLAERVGADIEKVRVGIGSDPRIGYSFIYPGAGYGGSCFPKDVQGARRARRETSAIDAEILEAVEAVNKRQKQLLFDKISRVLRRQARRAGPSRCGAWRSSRTPTTCARRRAATSWKRCGRDGADRAGLRSGGDGGGAAHLWRSRPTSRSAESARRRSRAPMRWPSSPSGRSSAARTSRRSEDSLQAPGDLRRPQSLRSGVRAQLRPALLRHRSRQAALWAG